MEKAKELLEKFLSDELEDYSYFRYEIKESNYGEEDWFSVEFHTEFTNKFFNSIEFKVENDTVYLELSEDSWEKVEYWDWTVKYFWMKLLKWK